ncbi:hypothetical protein [Cyanothece sp. BG0011]|uniref:hypothetical protein n=1 Tax=Cyanothece sp. BG0011 TaxID=2082950 RepID=UPI000D1F3E61|nr:hypothetical protein [Cyanothece sp. BG0011]
MTKYGLIIVGNDWRPGIGDPTIMGWVTVLCYFITALLCFKCGQKHKNDYLFWWPLALLLIILGINKQLDLQSWLTIVGKKMAIEQGWYEKRRLVQKDFIISLIAISGAIFMFIMQRMKTKIKQFILPILGIVFLLIFIIIRATSFHHVDQLLGWKLGEIRVNWLLELGGISCLAIAACKEILKPNK